MGVREGQLSDALRWNVVLIVGRGHSSGPGSLVSWLCAAGGSGLPLRWLAPLPRARSGGSDYPECPLLA